MTLRVTTPDVTRYHSSEIVDRFVPAEFLCAWIRYEFSKKIVHFLYIDDNDSTLRLLEGVDGTCLDKSLVHNSGQHSMTYKISGGIELSGEGQAVIVSFIFPCTIIAVNRYHFLGIFRCSRFRFY